MCRRTFTLVSLILVFFVSQSSVRADLADGLVGYWPLDGNGDDASGNGNHGTVRGNVTPVADRFGNADSAMNFPGNTSNYIDLGQPPMLLIKGAMSITAWVRAETLNQTGRIIAKQGPASARPDGVVAQPKATRQQHRGRWTSMTGVPVRRRRMAGPATQEPLFGLPPRQDSCLVTVPRLLLLPPHPFCGADS